MNHIAEIAHKRNDGKMRYGVKEKFEMERGPLASHIMGVAGEWAVAKAYGVEMDLSYGLRGDVGYDLVINGWCCEVKCASRRGSAFLLRETDPSTFRADFGLLVYQLPDHVYQVYGAISAKRLVEHGHIVDLGYGPRWCVSTQYLTGPEVIEETHK